MNGSFLRVLVRRMTYEALGIVSFELVDPQGSDLPSFAAGAHIDVRVPGGFVRQYSLHNHPQERHRYCIAVLKERPGTGGSRSMHENVRVGDLLTISYPRCHFRVADGAHRHLLVQAGKEGTVYLIDRDHMGHYNPNNNDQIVQHLDLAVGGVWAMPAWWNNNVYFGGSYDFIKMYAFNPSTGLLSTSPTSESAVFISYPGPTPSISANGDSNGIAWVLQTDGSSCILRAYDATNLDNELYDSTQNSSRDGAGGAVKFAVPTIANGKVYVPAVKTLSVYGLLGTNQATGSAAQ